MLSYYISQSNEFVVRTRNTGSYSSSGSGDDFHLKLQDMLTYETSSYDLSGSWDFNPYENIFTFSQSLEGDVSTGQEFFVEISGSVSGSLYYGSMQIYSSQSVDKTVYTTQNEEFVSNTSNNDYIVL